MNNDESQRRKPAMRGAMEGGCSCWAPIRPAANDETSENATADTDPQTTPDAVSGANGTPPPAPDAEA